MAADLESIIKPNLYSVTQKLSDAIRLRLIRVQFGVSKTALCDTKQTISVR